MAKVRLLGGSDPAKQELGRELPPLIMRGVILHLLYMVKVTHMSILIFLLMGFSMVSKSWSRRQKRVYRNIRSWCTECLGRGCQLLRVDLTTAVGVSSSTLQRDFQELRRRVERKFGYVVEYFKVETSEGNGLYHMIWAIEEKSAVYIPQSWLSDQWQDIHNSPVVYIRRMKSYKRAVANVANYLVTQYLAAQSALVRVSYSWWRAKVAIVRGWNTLFREFKKRCDVNTWCGLNGSLTTVAFGELLKAWHDILTQGRCSLAGVIFFVHKRDVICRDASCEDAPVLFNERFRSRGVSPKTFYKKILKYREAHPEEADYISELLARLNMSHREIYKEPF